jgi:hypothetical protein
VAITIPEFSKAPYILFKSLLSTFSLGQISLISGIDSFTSETSLDETLMDGTGVLNVMFI